MRSTSRGAGHRLRPPSKSRRAAGRHSRPVDSRPDGSAVRFGELGGYLDQLEATNSRNELVRILSELYGASSVAVIEPITYLIQGRLAPFFEPIEIGLGERMVISAIAMAYGTPKDEVSRLYRQVGDLGVTAQRLAPKTERDGPAGAGS